MSNYISVTKLNEYVRRYLEENMLLSGLAVCGEISGYKRHYSGHIYFTLKDSESVIQCSFFKGDNYSLRFDLEDGMQVVVYGSPTVYSKQGKYHFIVRKIEPLGEGDAAAKLEALKNKLRAEGLFDEAKKRQLPFLPERIGVVTSRTGAVFHDILNVTRRRAPNVNILLSPVAVQGAEAPADIVRGLELIQNYDVDVIIIGRGGGSAEELNCFNDENVVRAVARCKVPVISAVGHETDFTLCDFAADKRAATPSQAAEFAVADISTVKDTLDYQLSRSERMVRQKLQNLQDKLEAVENHYLIRQPERIIEDRYQEIDDIERRLSSCVEGVLTETEHSLGRLCGIIDGLSPLKVLARGYGVISDERGASITDAEEINIGQTVKLRFSNGGASAQVTEVYK